MTSVEKRHSGRKSGRHRRKQSDGGYSDTSSGGSFLDETDREVSNLTDRAFRSLCIGDEAVYNDSDLSSSPCSHRDRQLAFGQSCQDRGKVREELKRAAHESFSLRVQQYGQDWIHGGMYGARIHRDPQWEVYGERTQGRVSATFQHSFVETSQEEEALREEQLSFLSNGATEVSSQQRRSRSRVSSLIRAFNSEGHRDGAGMDGKVREINDETSWDKSALMSIQRELSEFSTSYQPDFNSGHFPSAGPFQSQDPSFYSSEAAAVAHMNSESSFMRSSHSKHSMSTQVSCNSNFFIHSEFSPFKVWRDHNRFPFQQGEVSGFMHRSEFSKWYETPMYKELSLQSQDPYRFEERGIRHARTNHAPVRPSSSRSSSTSTVLQKALAVEKRCESELAGHYPHRKQMQSLGANRIPSQRPSTASPTWDMTRRVQDTISSVKALREKIQMMTEQNMATGMTANQQGVFGSTDNLIPLGNNVAAPNILGSRSNAAPFNISQLLTPSVHAHHEVETSEVQQCAASPQLVEHPPVRAESRGATPDVRMSSYKSRATSLLFNLKDNRKRVKSTYSPTKFKSAETPERNKQPSVQQPRDIVIDIPDFPDPEIQYPHMEESNMANAVSYQYVNQYHNPGLPHYQQTTGQYSENTSNDYRPAQMQGELLHHSGYTGFIPENYASNQLANGQNQQGMMDTVETLGGDVYSLKPHYTTAEIQRLNADNNHGREYLISKATAEQRFNETVGREFTSVDGYQQLKESKDYYSNVSSQDRWRHTNSHERTENLRPKPAISPWKQEIMEKDPRAHAYQRPAAINQEMNLSRDKYRGESQHGINREHEKIEVRESFGIGTSSKERKTGPDHLCISNQPLQPSSFSNNNDTQPGAFKDMYLLPHSYGQSDVQNNYLPQSSNTFTDQEHRNQHTLDPNKDKTMQGQEINYGKSIPQLHEVQNPQPVEAKSQFVNNIQKNSSSIPNKSSSLTLANQADRSQIVDVKAQQAAAEHIKEQHAQAELAKGQHWAQVEQPKVETARIILAEQTRSEKVKAEQAKAELTERQTETEVKAEHLTDMKHKEEQTELCKDQTTKEQKKTEQTRAEITKEPENLISKTGAKHMREVQGEQVKREQAEAEQLKEEHIKTEVVKTEPAEQARKQQTEKPRKEEINVESFQEERVLTDKPETVSVGAELIRAEEVKAEQAEAERRKAEQATVEQKKEQPEKQESTKGNPAKGDEASAKQPNVDEVKKEKVTKEEEEKLQQTKLELPGEEPIKAEKKTAKPADKVTTKQVKNELDKVERVKTELAKAKAELAKIKEKMRGEQKEKVQNASVAKADGLQRDAPSIVNISKKDEYRYQFPATQKHQQKDDSAAVRRESTNHVNAGVEYERLREKYGFTDTDSPNRNKLSAKGDTALDGAKNELALTLDKADTTSKEILKDKHRPTDRFPTDNTDNKAEESSFKFNEEQESRYVYSESSKEFKLSGADYLPASVEAANSDATYKVKESSEKLGKYEPLKHTEVSQQSESNKAKSLPSEKKPRSSETSLGPGKNLHFTPPKSLSHKERAQTKQEILTSKIKAHAEKEISAIKEKGYAIRDGFISKTSTKQLASSHSNNPQHRPSSQEMSKKHESTLSSNATQKQQIHPSVTQMDPVKSGSALTSVATSSQLSVTKETMSNNNVAKPATESRQTGSYKISADDGLVQNQEKKNEFGKKPLTQSKELPQNNKSGKPEESLAPAVNSNKLDKEDTSHNTTLVKNKSSKSTTEEKAEDSKNEDSQEESAPSLSLVLGQRETPDDSLQIMGIMVTVRERNPTQDISEKKNSAHEQVNATEKECSKSERDGCHSRTLEESKGNECSVEGAKHNQHEKVQNMSTVVTKQSNTTDNVTVKKTNSSTNTRLQRDTQLQAPLTEKGVPSTATGPDKNKVPAETQSPLYKQETTARETKDYTNEMENLNSAKTINKDEGTCNTEEKDPPKMQTAHTNENFIAKMADNETDSTKGQAEILIKRDTESATKEHMTTAVNLLKSSSTDGKNAPLLEEKRTTPEQLNKALSKSSTENENEAKIQQSNGMDDNVHIGSISIRVMPAVPEQGSLKIEGKNSANPPSDSVNEHKQVVSSSSEEKVNSKEFTSASSEKQMKISLGDTNQANRRSIANENTRTINRKTETVNESGKSADDSKSMEGEYFEVRGSVETNTPHNSANVGDASDVATKERELPGLLLNKKVVSSESCGERKNVFSLDQTKMKTAESSSERVQDENMKRRKQETEDNLAPKQSGGPTERQGDKHERTEEAQAFHVRKQHTGSQSSLSAKERPSSRKPNASRENTLHSSSDEPKPKERVSIIPEISALADYARLKVIVSEDRENPVQEFPPNKKEGFFPLIQSRHSRRPVFTADPPDLPVKKKSLPSKTEVVPKVNKEPKPVVFPITEKEHQRTGMFKLGDKERQDRVLPEASGHGEVLDSALQYEQQLRGRIKSQTDNFEKQGSRGQVVGNDTQRDVHPNNPPIQASALFSESSQVGTASASQHLNQPVKSNSHKKPEELSPKPGRIQYLDKNSQSQPSVPVEQMHRVEDNNPATVRKDETTENVLSKTGEDGLTVHPGETTAKQNATQQLANKQVSKITMDRRGNDVKIKHILQETRASLAEEERRAAQREEERRAREREAIVFEIKERREKQRETEKRAVGERKAKKTEEEKAAQKEEEERVKQRGDANRQEEQQRRAAQEEQQRRVVQEEQQRRVVQEEQQRRDAEEQQRRAAQEEQQRRAAEEQQRKVAQEEQQRRVVQEEQQRRAAEEQQRRVAQEEQQRRAAEEQKRREAEEQQRKAAEEQKRRAAEEQQRRAAQEEQQRRAAQEEQQRRAAEEQQRRAAQEEQQRRAAEEQQRRNAQILREERMSQTEEQGNKHPTEELERQKWLRTQRQEEENKIKQHEEERTRLFEEDHVTLKEEEKRVAKEWMLAQEEESRAKKREEETLTAYREKERATQEQKRAAQLKDALQYYAITSSETERKARERQLCSPSPSQQKHTASGIESTENSHTRLYRPHTPASPAPSLPRSNTSSPALGIKPSMFRVKDNTVRGSAFHKSVKPRFHKNFGEDFRVGSPMGSEKGEEEQNTVRRSAVTPHHSDSGLNRLGIIKESSPFQPETPSQDHSAPLSYHRPYSRRSIALDEDESRSIISNMSEDMESFATSATDVADIRGLYDYDRPESACSFSSDVSRSLGKPPVVPPKSEKALRRAQRLTSRRIKKELSKGVALEKPHQEDSGVPSSFTEVRSPSRHAVASPHFSPPISLAHAPKLESSLPSSQTEHPSHSSVYASPHVTGPISLPATSPHATAPISLPVALPHAAGPVSHPAPAAPKTVTDVPSSPTFHHANHSAPVTQYHVESTYPQSYPLTQRKVLQDLGSGQYFVVDVPVQVKTKTFFDPETGKYVQLNVRESVQSASRPQQLYPQSQLKPQIHVKPQQQPLSQNPPASNPNALYHSYHDPPQGYQPTVIKANPQSGSSGPMTLHQDQQPVRESHSNRNLAPEMGQNSEGYRYSPEKTPYMDTVNNTDKTFNAVYNTHGPYEPLLECDTNSQLAGSSVCENENSAHSRYQPRNIITMSELEDFMEASDW